MSQKQFTVEDSTNWRNFRLWAERARTTSAHRDKADAKMKPPDAAQA